MQEHRFEEQAERFDELSEADRDILCNWIGNHIWLRETPNYDRISCDLKNLFNFATGSQVSNGEFKGAMIACGFKPTNKRKLYCYYRISKRSPAFD